MHLFIAVDHICVSALRSKLPACLRPCLPAELSHVTMWLNRAMCPAAGHVAMSRVKHDEDYLIGGIVTPEHFIPAR